MTELNEALEAHAAGDLEATVVAEREAMVAVAEQAMKAGKSRKEAGELAMKARS